MHLDIGSKYTQDLVKFNHKFRDVWLSFTRLTQTCTSCVSLLSPAVLYASERGRDQTPIPNKLIRGVETPEFTFNLFVFRDRLSSAERI